MCVGVYTHIHIYTYIHPICPVFFENSGYLIFIGKINKILKIKHTLNDFFKLTLTCHPPGFFIQQILASLHHDRFVLGA